MQISAMPLPRGNHIPTKFLCEIQGLISDPADSLLEMVGDIDAFATENKLETGDVLVFEDVSLLARKIFINAKTLPHIRIMRKSRISPLNTRLVGVKKVLVVRVSRDYSSNAALKLTITAPQLTSDFFYDENNLRKVYQRCSWNKLKLQPATGSGVSGGVITINPDDDLCSTDHLAAVGNIRAKLASLGIQFDFAALVFPDCVDFRGAAAWGQVIGMYTWYLERYASFPIAQVHELGHNLGLHHSGKNGVEYGDDVGYMGNQALWTDAGSVMCFNPAKTWYLGWYSYKHISVDPSLSPFKGKLVGIADRAAIRSGEYFVLGLTGSSDSLFLMFNRKKGINNGVVGDADKLVITRQLSMGVASVSLAAIGPDESVTIKDWTSQNLSLVVKFCSLQKISVTTKTGVQVTKSVADITVHVAGRTNAECS